MAGRPSSRRALISEAKAIPSGELPIVEGLHPDSVSGREERALLGIPDGERKHPTQHLQTPFAMPGIEMQQDLGVAIGSKGSGQWLAKLAEIVDLAVVGEGERAQGHGLVAGGRQVENRQPGVAELGIPRSPDIVEVRSPVSQRPRHALDGVGLGRVPDDAANPTHDATSSPRPGR